MKNFLLIVLGLSLALSSCGAGGASTSINVTMTDFKFEPAAFTVPAGQEIAFTSQNNGAVIHNFVIMNLGTDAGEAFDDSDSANVYWQVDVKPGGSVNTTFTAPSEPGEYQVVCSIQGHIMAGMVGSLTVVAGE